MYETILRVLESVIDLSKVVSKVVCKRTLERQCVQRLLFLC